jgi:hypothetical protein
VILLTLGSLLSKHADEMNMPLVRFPVGALLTSKSGPQEHKFLLNDLALENCFDLVKRTVQIMN